MSSSKQQNSINIGAWAMSYQNTILDQMLQMFPRFQFQQLTKKTLMQSITLAVSLPGTISYRCYLDNPPVKIVREV